MKHLLTDQQVAILADIAFFHYLTSDQLQRVRYYRSEKPRYAQGRLAQLCKLGYIEQVKVRIVSTSARSPYIWKLTKDALPVLRTIRVKATVPSGEKAGQWVFFLHHFLVNDFLIAAARLLLEHPDVRITKLLHDRELHRIQPYLVIDGKKRQCVPDGFVLFTVRGEPYPLALEVDRDEERAPQWRLKVRKLVAWADGPYKEFAGTSVLTVAVVVQGRTEQRTQDRVTQLMDWTHDELERLGKRHYASIFLFSPVPPTALTPTEYFFTAHWQTPSTPEERYPLLNP